MILFSCARQLPNIEKTVFASGFIRIEMDRRVEIFSARVNTPDGTRVARAVFSKGYSGRSVRIDFNWKANSPYQIHVSTKVGEIRYSAVSPRPAKDESFVFHFPFGMNSRRTIVPKGTEIIGSLELRNDSPLPRHLEVRIGFPRGFSMKDPHRFALLHHTFGGLGFFRSRSN